MLNFDFLENGLGIVSPPHMCMIFQEKYFMLHSINWIDFIVWLPLLLEILGSMFMVIVCQPSCDIMNFKISFF